MKVLQIVVFTVSVRLSSSLLKFNEESCTDLEPYPDPITGTDVGASDPASSTVTISVNANIITEGLPLLVDVEAGAGFPFLNVFLSTYCTSCQNPHQFLGTFSAVEGLQLISCDGDPASAVTRDDFTPIEALSFVWQSIPRNTETFFFVATVVHNDTVFWKDLKSGTLSSPSSSSPSEPMAEGLMLLPETEPEVTTEGVQLMMRCSACIRVPSFSVLYMGCLFGAVLSAL